MALPPYRPKIDSPRPWAEAKLRAGSEAAPYDDFTLDVDENLTANSDARIATQKAVKAYVDTHGGGGGPATTDELPEGVVNLYYTDTRARASLSYTGVGGTYNDVTGVITFAAPVTSVAGLTGAVSTAGLSTALSSYFDPAGAAMAAQAASQPVNSDLTTISGLAPVDNDILQRKSGAWTNRTIAQYKTDLAYTASDIGGLGALAALDTITSSYVTDFNAATNTLITAQKGVAFGLAPLDSSGKIDIGYIPNALIGAVNYQGTWNAATNTPTIPAAGTGNKGYYYVVSTAGTTPISGITDWQVGDWIISSGTSWDKIDNTDSVTSVAGLTGAITATNLSTALSSYFDSSGAASAAQAASQPLDSTLTTLSGKSLTGTGDIALANAPTFTGNITAVRALFSGGSATNPSVSFTNAPGIGLSLGGTTQLNVSVGGTAITVFTSFGLNMPVSKRFILDSSNTYFVAPATGELNAVANSTTVQHMTNTGTRFDKPANFPPVSAPASPASGWTIYTDSADGSLKAKDSSGTVKVLAP